MDQNRCLLDVIDNPQLLQSFLESESSAETTNNNKDNIQQQQAPTITTSTHHVTSFEPRGTTSNVAPLSPVNGSTHEETTLALDACINNLELAASSSSIYTGGGDVEENTIRREFEATAVYAQPTMESFVLNHGDTDDQSPIIDPIVSVLDSIITETVAETSPSNQNSDHPFDDPHATLSGTNEVSPMIDVAPIPQSLDDKVPSSFCLSSTGLDVSSPALDEAPSYHHVGIGNVDVNVNDANNNSTSSSDNGSNDLLVDEYYTQHLQNIGPVHEPFQHEQPAEPMDTSYQSDATLAPNPPKDTITTAFDNEENMSKSQSHQNVQQERNQLLQQDSSIQDAEQYHAPSQQSQPQDQNQFSQQSYQTSEPLSTCLAPQLETQQSQVTAEEQPQPTQLLPSQSTQEQQPSQQPQQPVSHTPIENANLQTQQPPSQQIQTNETKTGSCSTTKSPKNPKPNNKSTTNNAATKTPESKPKRAPRPKKNAKSSNNTAAVTQQLTTTTTNTPIKPMPTQYITTAHGQQQVIFQNNNGIRQPAILAPTSMAQPMGAMPQPQRVIQIQTANGPMYFAIAPGPATGANNSNVIMGQQQQQAGMQSHQYPSQQICFQSNNNVMMNRPQMTQTMPQQQRNQTPNQQSQINHQQLQHHQQLQSPQTHQQQQQQTQAQAGGNIVVRGPQIMHSPQRLASPMMTGQTIAIANQQNPHQQQHVILPPTQQMMMPRMPNQIIMNRPLGTTGQMMPGQQQFIQILTPNGPMLLALPQQQAQQQPVNNTMIDFNSQVQPGQVSRPIQQQQNMQQKPVDMLDGAVNMMPAKQTGPNPGAKNVSNSKSGLDLADLLLDCGILPEDRAASQSSSSMKSSQSPSLSQISSPMPSNLPQTNSPMPTIESASFSTNQPQPTPQTLPSYGQYQGQPIRITLGPDGQMIMQPAVYGAIRPVLAGGMAQSTHPTVMAHNNIIPSNSPMMAMSSSNPSTPKPTTDSATSDSSKKNAAKGKATAVKRSRSKKSDVDKFPQLKTPKIAQQHQQQTQQQQPQTVAIVPMNFLVGDQSKVLAGGTDIKPNVAQMAGGQQVSLAKFVSPVMQAASIQTPLGSNIIQTGVTPHANSLATNQVVNSGQMNTQLITNSANSINISSMQQQQQQQNLTSSMMTTSASTSTTSSSQMSSSGNVKQNIYMSDSKSGTVESNPHISSSLMPTISLTVDNPKIEQNGLKPGAGQNNQTIKGQVIHSVGGLTTTLVLHPAQAQQRHSIAIQSQAQLQQQQMARKKEMRAQTILNQLKADQNAALNPQTKQPFKSLEDACKRLLRYHVFDTETVSDSKLMEVDEIFEAAVESLLTRKHAIYDKFRYLILKQSMKNVPMSEEVMLEQVFVNDELSYLKKERELFREYEAHLENVALKQSRDDSKSDSQNDCEQNYYAFGPSSPKRKDQVDQDNVAHSRDVDDWLLPDKWSESRYQSVPDSEAATAIESILNEEIS